MSFITQKMLNLKRVCLERLTFLFMLMLRLYLVLRGLEGGRYSEFIFRSIMKENDRNMYTS